DNDIAAYTELMYGIPPNPFDYIKQCSNAHEIWITLEAMFEGNESIRDKKMTSTINKFNSFQKLSGETLNEACNRFKLIVNELMTLGIPKTKLELNIGFLNGLDDRWITIRMILQGNGNLKRMSLQELFGELIAQESTVEQQYQKMYGGNLALLSSSSMEKTESTNSNIPSTLQTFPTDDHGTSSHPMD
ncbi:hypothetical protein E9993_23445, partial [Labilibacter sediminis]